MRKLPKATEYQSILATVPEPSQGIIGVAVTGFHPDIGQFTFVSPSKEHAHKLWGKSMELPADENGMQQVVIFQEKNVRNTK